MRDRETEQSVIAWPASSPARRVVQEYLLAQHRGGVWRGRASPPDHADQNPVEEVEEVEDAADETVDDEDAG